MSTIGLRYERLLFWAAPITLAACAVFIANLGYNTQQERLDATCYDKAANAIKDHEQDFSNRWRQVEKDRKREGDRSVESTYYNRDISVMLIYAIHSECWQLINDQKIELIQNPSKLIELFTNNSETLKKKPIRMYGIEIPDTATVSVLGTSIKIAIGTFIQALQVALAPVLLLWLGSLYHTRLREALSLKKIDSILSVYPHVINVFPTGTYPALRKKNFWLYHAPTINATFHYLVRLSLLLVFIAPSVILYISSLTFQPIFTDWSINLFIGFWISIYSLGILLMELSFGKKHFQGIEIQQ
jgi:hypothetical protein